MSEEKETAFHKRISRGTWEVVGVLLSIVVVILAYYGQYVAFSQHVTDFESHIRQEIVEMKTDIEKLDSHVRPNTIAIATIERDLKNIYAVMERIEEKVSKL